ncbi:MAG: GDSL family lipase [Oscillospiraceae bacterium]|nr:GDSL family lipase [Oscillospiraceae bacterium]
MKIKRIISLISAAAMTAMLFTACNGGGTAEETTVTEEHDMTVETTYTASEENVKHLGRTYFSEDKLYCALSGSGAEFSFNGTKCVIKIKGDSTSMGGAAQADNQARVAVYVNGERVVDDMVDNAFEEYTVFESATAEDVTVSVVKLSESPMSTIAIDEIKVTGTVIKPTANKDLFIEFIGDSITCGYGSDDPVKENHFSTKTEDVTKAYAYKTAQALGADYSMVSFSGYGIISGYSTNDQPVTAQTVPQFYTKLGYCWGSNGNFKPSNVEWDFSKRQPDVIVINLGTNDDSYTKTEADRQQAYADEYVNFLKTIREKNPDAKIVCTLGVMGDRLFEYVQLAADTYKAETGDNNIYTMKFDVQDPNDGYSADWHPSITTHDKAAAKLTAELKTLLGL